MGRRISVEEPFNLSHSGGILSLIAQDMGLCKVEKLGHSVLTSFCISGLGRSLQTAVLCSAVVFLMGKHMANVDAAQVIAHIDDKPIFVPANIEHCPPLSEETCRSKILADLVWAAIVLQSCNGQPGFQRALGIRMGFPKRLKPLPRNHVHQDCSTIVYTPGLLNSDNRVSQV